MSIFSSKPLLATAASTLGLMLFYLLTMRLLTSSWYAAFSQFQNLWYLMLPLSVGFGIQVGIYTNLRLLIKQRSQKILAGNAAVSTFGMIACCAHHLTDILPILGLSAVSIFLINFQIPILILGIFSNILGIIYLLRMESILKHKS